MKPINKISSLVVAGAVALGLQACGGDDEVTDPPEPTTATTIEGTVAVGAAVPGASITVADADAASADVSGVADANGAYSLDVSSLTAPLLVSARGTLNGEPVSVVAVVPALTAQADNTANVTSLTNAVAALVAPGGDLNALTTPAAIAAVTARSVADASSLVVNTLKSNPSFAALLGTDFDPLKTPFSANGTGIDAVLDQVAVEVGSSGVAITNLSAPAATDGQAAAVVLTTAQTSTPNVVPTLPPSTAASELPTVAEMTALAKKLESCLSLPTEQRVTMDAAKEVTAVSPACSFGPAQWKSDGGNWVDRVGTNVLRYDISTGMKAGTPTVAAVLPAPNHSGTTFQHPYCNAATCVVMNIPLTSASGKPTTSTWLLGRIGGAWDYVGNQLPYALGVEHRLNRKVSVNTALAAANPANYFLQDRMESAIRLNFNPEASGAAATANIRAVVWKGPGLPSAGIVTHRSQRCGTDDRFPITNQEGLLTVNNSGAVQFWNNGGGIDFIVDSAKLDGSALAMPVPSANWASNATPFNQDVRSTPFAGTVAAWSVYTAEIYYFTNTGPTPDEVVHVRNSTPYEPAAVGTARNWPTLAPAFIEANLTPTGSKAGSLTSLAQTMEWTNPIDGYVSFAYLFSQNRETATNSQNETSNFWKRGNMFFRPNAFGDTGAAAFEWAANQSGTSLSPSTATTGSNPNPRCTSEEVLPLDAGNGRSSFREAGLQFRGPDRKLYQLTHFWSN